MLVWTTRETYPLRLLALLTLINVYYVKWHVRIRKVMLLLFIAHQISYVINLKTFYLILKNLKNLNKQIKWSFTVILGDFNAGYSDWWQDDITSPEGTHIDYLISMYVFDQLISDPAHILAASTSCIDFIFTDQPNVVVGSGFHHFLHANCHHQITYCNLNLMIFYPPPKEPMKVL